MAELTTANLRGFSQVSIIAQAFQCQVHQFSKKELVKKTVGKWVLKYRAAIAKAARKSSSRAAKKISLKRSTRSLDIDTGTVETEATPVADTTPDTSASTTSRRARRSNRPAAKKSVVKKANKNKTPTKSSRPKPAAKKSAAKKTQTAKKSRPTTKNTKKKIRESNFFPRAFYVRFVELLFFSLFLSIFFSLPVFDAWKLCYVPFFLYSFVSFFPFCFRRVHMFKTLCSIIHSIRSLWQAKVFTSAEQTQLSVPHPLGGHQ